MASTKLTAKTELTTAHDADLFYIVDSTDTTDGINGTSKKIKRQNLGLAKSGANSDITSLTGLTTPLTVAQGGIGVATLAAGLVRGNGTSPLTSVTTSAGVLALISDATGTGLLTFATSPVLTTPNIGVATATSVNKVAITAPATSATLTIANGKTLTANSSITIAGADGKTFTFNDSATIGTNAITLAGGEVITFSATNALSLLTSGTTVMTFPAATDTVATLAAVQVMTNKTLTLPTMQGSITTYTVDADGATVTFTLGASNWHSVILGGNRILAISGISVNQIFMLDLIQDGTGSRTVTWFDTYSATATVTIAAPGVLTLGIDVPTLTPVFLTTTGALPTGLTASTVYYYTRVDATTGKLSTTVANAQAGTFITTTGSQSGTHTSHVQIRWPSQLAPTLSTGKFTKDSFGFKSISNGVIDGVVIQQGT